MTAYLRHVLRCFETAAARAAYDEHPSRDNHERVIVAVQAQLAARMEYLLEETASQETAHV